MVFQCCLPTTLYHTLGLAACYFIKSLQKVANLQLRSLSKKEFLERMERLIPWEEWKAIIEPHYYKGERGNKPYDLELMLRLFVVQNLYSLSDMATRDEAIDSRAFSAFCGTNVTGQVPDGDTIGRFRRLLEKPGQWKVLQDNKC